MKTLNNGSFNSPAEAGVHENKVGPCGDQGPTIELGRPDYVEIRGIA